MDSILIAKLCLKFWKVILAGDVFEYNDCIGSSGPVYIILILDVAVGCGRMLTAGVLHVICRVKAGPPIGSFYWSGDSVIFVFCLPSAYNFLRDTSFVSTCRIDNFLRHI